MNESLEVRVHVAGKKINIHALNFRLEEDVLRPQY